MNAMHDMASALARQAAQEDSGALKVIVVEDGNIGGMVFKLLTKVHQVPKNQIVQLGYTSTDEQNEQLLRKKKPFVIVPKDIVNNRPCIFHLPEGSNLLSAIQVLDGEIFAMPIACNAPEFQFKPGWFS